MLQFYFLSILLNIVAGLVFLYSSKEPADSASDDIFNDAGDDEQTFSEIDLSVLNSLKDDKTNLFAVPLFEDSSFRLVLGILMVLTGLMKLLSPIQYDVPVLGDLIPSLAGIAGGISILLDWYNKKSSMGVLLPEILNTIFIEGKKYLGVFCIAAGILHFIFPRVLFL